jgi:hypothetical protein
LTVITALSGHHIFHAPTVKGRAGSASTRFDRQDEKTASSKGFRAGDACRRLAKERDRFGHLTVGNKGGERV